MISQIVKDVLEELSLAPVVADWLEEHCLHKPEVAAYMKKFRKMDKLRVIDAIDVIAKFGEPLERRQIQRFRRLLKRARHKPAFPEKAIPLVKDMAFKTRSNLNAILKATRNGPRAVSQRRYKFILSRKIAEARTAHSALILDLSEMLGA